MHPRHTRMMAITDSIGFAAFLIGALTIFTKLHSFLLTWLFLIAAATFLWSAFAGWARLSGPTDGDLEQLQREDRYAGGGW